MPAESDEPQWVYQVCYQVLRANHDPRQKSLLQHAYNRLQEQANRIPDEETRRAFLENVPYQAAIVAAYDGMDEGVE